MLGCCVWAHGYGLIAVLEYKLSSIRQVTTYRQHSTLTAGSKCHTLETTQLVGKCCGGVRREMGSAELLAQDTQMNSEQYNNSIPDRTSTGLTRSASFIAHQDKYVKLATDEKTIKKIKTRHNTYIGTWNVRTLRVDGKLEELIHELDRYRWNILGLSEIRKKGINEIQTLEGHKLYYVGNESKHINGVGFIVNKQITSTVMCFNAISDRIAIIRLQATPFNISIIQVYAPTTEHSDEEIEVFYNNLQNVIKTVSKKDILVIQGDWNAKIGKDTIQIWGQISGKSCNNTTNERGHRLLEFAKTNDLIAVNTFGSHKNSRIQTWHSPGGLYHNQIDYIFVSKRFSTSVNVNKTRSFPGADIGSDHDMVLMKFTLRLKSPKKNKFARNKFNLDKLKDAGIKEIFKQQIENKVTEQKLNVNDNIEESIQKLNKLIINKADEVLGKYREKKKSWITNELLDMYDLRRQLKKTKHEPGSKYKTINTQIKRDMKKAKDNWIKHKCADLGNCLNRNNSKKAYQIVKDLTKRKNKIAVNIQDKDGKCITDKEDVLKRWTEYCSELYKHQANGDKSLLNVKEPTNQENFSILESEVEAAIQSLKIGKSPGVDNIPAELLKAGGHILTKIFTNICNYIWETGIWPSCWTKSLIISLHKKGSFQKCENYRTISLISHSSKIMLKIILRRLQHFTEEFLSEEQAGFRKGRSTSEHIFNLRVISEKYSQHNKPLYHVFIDFKKAFDRVWHSALWSTMKRFNINLKLIETIENLYSKAESAVYIDGKVGEWFRTTTGVRQGCLLSPTLFNIMLEQIMNDALDKHDGTVNIGGKIITNLRFADDIDALAGSEKELHNLITLIDNTSRSYGMEINGTKTQLMTNSEDLHLILV